MPSQKVKTRTPQQNPFLQIWPWMVLVLILLLFGYVRLRMAPFALERDEGEYAYAGQLLLQGIPPYKLAYNMKLPGTYGMYAISMALFGQTPSGIHAGLLLANFAAITFVFLIARRFSGNSAAVVASATYALMSTSHTVVGVSAHASHFVVVFALAAIWTLLKAHESGSLLRFFLSGVLFGLSFVMKQPGLAYAVFGAIWLLWTEAQESPFNWKRCAQRQAAMLGGVVVPFILVCVSMYASGVFETFWFWTFSYTRSYASSVPFRDGMRLLRDYFRDSTGPVVPFWVFALLGLGLAMRRELRLQTLFLFGFCAFSALAVSAGLYFRPHYFVMMLPATALCVGVAVQALRQIFATFSKKMLVRAIPAVCFVAVWGWSFYFHVPLFFQMTADEAPDYLFPNNPFKETAEVGEYIREHSSPDDTVAVLGSEPEIYFYSRRHSATGYIYTYPLMEKHPHVARMQQEMISEITKSNPKFYVIVAVPYSWATQPDSDKSILQWSNAYAAKNYDLVKNISIEEIDDPAQPNGPKGRIFLYQRKQSHS